MNAVFGSIGLVELHDAWVAGFHLQMGGEAEIEFSHIAVYHQTGNENEEKYNVWSYKARLLMQGVKSFELSGELAGDDYIMDDELTGRDGSRLRCEQLIGGADLARIFLSFFESGARVTITCGSGQLRLVEPLELMEKWSGPL